MPDSGGIKSIKAGPGMAAVLTDDGQVYAVSLKYSFYGTTTVLSKVNNLQNVVMVECNGAGGLALDNTGCIWKFSLDAERKAGAAEKITALSDVKSIAGGGCSPTEAFTTLALKNDGTVWAWGANNLNQLGDGTTQSSEVPIQISALGNSVQAIAAGSYQGLALKNDGTVWNWGKISPYTQEQTPVLLSGPSGVIKIDAGDNQNLAQQSDGKVWVWGHVPYPGWVPGINNPREITAGKETYFPVMFGKSDGTVWSSSVSMADGTPTEAERVNGLENVVLLDASDDAYYVQSDGTILIQSSTGTEPYQTKITL